MPRVNNTFNLIRYYKKGKLLYERKVASSRNIFLYYFLWYVYYFFILVTFPVKKERITVISFHPISFFLMSLQKLLRDIEYVYWVGDYFPPVSLSLRLYERLKSFYHRHVRYACYLSDRINEKMNGSIFHTVHRKTVMWGVKPKDFKKVIPKTSFTILFVGLIKESQGLESVLTFLKTNKSYKLKIVGVCPQKLATKYKKMIASYGISKRVYFPNAFVDDDELVALSKDCHVGIALYDRNPTNVTNFADPGKVKSYAEMKLPVIMSNISDIADYVCKFKSGIVINNNDELLDAFKKIKKDYSIYQRGLDKFNTYFYFEEHYKKAFVFLNEK